MWRLILPLLFSTALAQYEQGEDKPTKIFGEANIHKAQERLHGASVAPPEYARSGDAPGSHEEADPYANFGRSPPTSAEVPGTEPLPPAPSESTRKEVSPPGEEENMKQATNTESTKPLSETSTVDTVIEEQPLVSQSPTISISSEAGVPETPSSTASAEAAESISTPEEKSTETPKDEAYSAGNSPPKTEEKPVEIVGEAATGSSPAVPTLNHPKEDNVTTSATEVSETTTVGYDSETGLQTSSNKIAAAEVTAEINFPTAAENTLAPTEQTSTLLTDTTYATVDKSTQTDAVTTSAPSSEILSENPASQGVTEKKEEEISEGMKGTTTTKKASEVLDNEGYSGGIAPEKLIESNIGTTPAPINAVTEGESTIKDRYIETSDVTQPPSAPNTDLTEGSGYDKHLEGGLTPPAGNGPSETTSLIGVTIYAPASPTSAEIEAATLEPYASSSEEGSGKSLEGTDSFPKSNETTTSAEHKEQSIAEGSGYTSKELTETSAERQTEGSGALMESKTTPTDEYTKLEERKEAATGFADLKTDAEFYEEPKKHIEGDIGGEKIVIKEKPEQYVTAPGEKTAKPGVTLPPEASRTDGLIVKQASASLDFNTVTPIIKKKNEKDDTVTPLTTDKITVTNDFSTDPANPQSNKVLEPSGYEMGHEAVIITPDVPPIKPEDAVGYNGIAKEEPQKDLPQQISSNFNLDSGEAVKTIRKNTNRDSERPKWTPYRFDCSTEEDDKGLPCNEWAESGLCEQHRPTMFLFCRKTCLCTGPISRRKRFVLI